MKLTVPCITKAETIGKEYNTKTKALDDVKVFKVVFQSSEPYVRIELCGLTQEEADEYEVGKSVELSTPKPKAAAPAAA